MLHLAIAQDWFPMPPPHPGQCPSKRIGHNSQLRPQSEKDKFVLLKFFILITCKIHALLFHPQN